MNISYSLYSPALIKHTEFSIARSCTKKGNYVIMKLNKLTKPKATLFFLFRFSASKLLPRVGYVSVSDIFLSPFFCHLHLTWHYICVLL